MSERQGARATNEQRYFDALRRISQYETPNQARRTAKGVGLNAEEYLEMAYENIREEAKRAIKGKRRPVS